MTDKVQKIREEVERLQIELIQEKEKGFGSDTDDACILELQNVLTCIDSLQEEPIILTEEILKKNGFRLNPRPRYNPPYWSKLFTASDGREYFCKINMEQQIRETLMVVMPLASNNGHGHPTCLLPHPKTIQQLGKSLRLFNIKFIIEV